jgi:hypothetical protein
LDFLTVVAVRDLTTTYSLTVQDGQEALSAPVPAAVLQHDMQLLVAPDRPGLYLEMAQQLARWVAKSWCHVDCFCGQCGGFGRVAAAAVLQHDMQLLTGLGCTLRGPSSWQGGLQRTPLLIYSCFKRVIKYKTHRKNGLIFC